MSNDKQSKHVKHIPDSKAYARLKPITDAAQTGASKPWSPAIIDLLDSYKVDTQRLKDVRAQVNLSFPPSIKGNSIAIGFRYAKENGDFAEDLFVFVENVGLTCYYRGSQEKALPEYADTHHEKIDIKLNEFLPDLQKDIAEIRQQIEGVKTTADIEFISDETHLRAMKEVADEFKEKVRSFQAAHGQSPSAVQQYSRVAQAEATKKRSQLLEKKAQSDRAHKTNMPEISLEISAQASNEEFEVQLVNSSRQTLVAERIDVNGVVTELEQQQFSKLYPLQNVNIPNGIFDNPIDEVKVGVTYSTLGDLRYELTQIGKQENRADGRYNIVFSDPASIQPIL